MTDKHAAATGSSHPRHQENTVMPVKERADAIGRAERAVKALAEHPRATRKQLGTARERLNDCYRLSDPDAVWAAAQAIEASAAAVYGVPECEEPAPKPVRRWVSPRGHPRPAKARRPRKMLGN
jgi:hypothetical protein